MKNTPLITPHDVFLQRIGLAGVRDGVSRRSLQRAAGSCSDAGLTRILRGEAHLTNTSVSAALLIGSMLGVPSDQILVGHALPEPDPFATIEALVRLLDLSKTVPAR